MKHPTKGDIARPLRLPGDLVGNTGHGIRRPDHLVLADRFGRGISRDGEPVETRQAVAFGRGCIDLRAHAGNRNFEIELLAFDELAVTDALAAARTDGLRDDKLRDGNTALR